MARYELGYDLEQWCFGSIRAYYRKGVRKYEMFDTLKNAEKRKKQLCERNKENKNIYINFCIREIKIENNGKSTSKL